MKMDNKERIKTHLFESNNLQTEIEESQLNQSKQIIEKVANRHHDAIKQKKESKKKTMKSIHCACMRVRLFE